MSQRWIHAVVAMGFVGGLTACGGGDDGKYGQWRLVPAPRR